ncbi:MULTISPECIES: DUF2339 domain-containing protein [unclassified Clostridium]|uniref:DUF2339 domain-containing protein n=1 Tax=unclassified Clostridium TaxID=2614128 RepID=UPI000297B397|nr:MULTISPECIES: DUF2339 domain-containing protein [unclassified Clostridium]EKQ56845.1 MAG: putative membrane protein (DUF2339) [Clostridium sp. Maddingley MBC34-26]
MSTVDNLQNIIDKQKEVLYSLETELTNMKNSNILIENQSLKTELQKYKEFLEKEKSDNLKISEENKKLRNALYEQFYNEKIQILNVVNSKIDVYYKSNISGEIGRLTNLEVSVKKQIDDMVNILKANRVNIEDEIYKKLGELRDLINAKIILAREEVGKRVRELSENRAEEFAKLKQEKVTEEEIKARVKQNNIESFIGLNIMNKLGVLLLVISVITASQFAYTRLPDALKCALAFIFGIVMLIAGELLNRKKPNVFSLGITSGGVAVLYVAIALSFFKFGILNMYTALGMCILITVLAFVLSQRYNSQTISIFAMIGGYLPIFSIAGSRTIVYGAMVYFVVLNMFALIISVNRKWNATAYIGFALNVMGSFYISAIMFFGRPRSAEFSISDFITILYIIFAFITYTIIPVISSFRKKLSFNNADIVLMTFNTVISTFLLYSVFYILKLSDFTGILSIIFAVVYLSLGKFVEDYMTKEQKARALFYITGLTFIVLVIPFQFGKVWLSLGWLIEGIALLSYGIYKELKDFKKAGVIISSMCLAAFILFDVTNLGNPLFVYKYLAITIGSIIVLSLLVYKKDFAEKSKLLFKYIVTINSWIFLLYIIGDKVGGYLSRIFAGGSLNLNYLITAAMILASFLTAYFIPRIKYIYDKAMKVISYVIYIIALIAALLLNFASPVRGALYEANTVVCIIGTLELAIIAILAILALRDLILSLVLEGNLGIEWYPLIISFYFVVVLTQNLITQYGLGFNNAVISIIYLLASFAWITFGFIKRYAFIRRFGLGLSILSVAKLFIIDLSFISQGYRIVSYFIFGVTLIVISFIYQYFSKKIDSIGEVIPNDEKTNG